MIEAVTLDDVIRLSQEVLQPESAAHVFVGRIGAAEQELRRITGNEG